MFLPAITHATQMLVVCAQTHIDFATSPAGSRVIYWKVFRDRPDTRGLRDASGTIEDDKVKAVKLAKELANSLTRGEVKDGKGKKRAID
jgi:hypothetical protein